MARSVKSEPIRHLTQEQVTAFFGSIPKDSIRDRVLFGLIYRYGLRASEAAQLPSAAINVSRAEVTIVGSKNGTRRAYAIPRDILKLVKRYKPEGSLYFDLTRERVYQLFRRYADAAGLPRGAEKGRHGLGPHSLRHSIAVHMLDSGLATEDVKDRLRHKKLATSEIYATLSTRRRNDYQRRMDESAEIVKL